MATIDNTKIQTGNTRAVVIAWMGLTNGDVGREIDFSQYTDRSVQVSGAFGDGALVIEGSNNGTDFAVLTDPQGSDLNLISAKIELVTEATRYLRPRVTGNTGASINVHLLIKE